MAKPMQISTGILNFINTKDKMYKLPLKTDTLTDKYMTQKARVKTTSTEISQRSIKKTKNMCYIKVFDLYRNDMKKIG